MAAYKRFYELKKAVSTAKALAKAGVDYRVESGGYWLDSDGELLCGSTDLILAKGKFYFEEDGNVYYLAEPTDSDAHIRIRILGWLA